MIKKTNKSVKSLINELFRKVYSNEMKIPDAVDSVMFLIENDSMNNEKNESNTDIDPLFSKGSLPVDELKHIVIQNIKKLENNNYMYFIHNLYNPYASEWINEDKLIEKINKSKNYNYGSIC